MKLQMAREILSILRAARKETKKGEWVGSYWEERGEVIEVLEGLLVRYKSETFDGSDPKFYHVSSDDDQIICICGNGPTAAGNAALIAHMQNAINWIWNVAYASVEVVESYQAVGKSVAHKLHELSKVVGCWR